MKFLAAFLLFFFAVVSAQKSVRIDSVELRDVEQFFADDYGNLYLYKNKNFSFTKYDSLGKHQGRMMFTLPFKIQNVQNPLNIVMFSENTQEMKFVDQNLVEIQKLELQKFGFIKMAYAEDLQQIWLLDESAKRLIQYNFRDDRIISSYPFFFSFDDVTDMLIYDSKLFLLRKNRFEVYNFSAEPLFSAEISDGKRLQRENENIYIITNTTFYKFNFPNILDKVFESKESQIVDKNSTSYFELNRRKLYLYPLGNRSE